MALLSNTRSCSRKYIFLSLQSLSASSFFRILPQHKSPRLLLPQPQLCETNEEGCEYSAFLFLFLAGNECVNVEFPDLSPWIENKNTNNNSRKIFVRLECCGPQNDSHPRQRLSVHLARKLLFSLLVVRVSPLLFVVFFCLCCWSWKK